MQSSFLSQAQDSVQPQLQLQLQAQACLVGSLRSPASSGTRHGFEIQVLLFLIKEHDSGLNNSRNCLQPHQEHRSNYAAPNNHQTHTSTPRLQQTAHMFTLSKITDMAHRSSTHNKI
jgi:hypothetical protein